MCPSPLAVLAATLALLAPLAQPRAQSTDWWSLRPLTEPDVPVTDPAWERTPVDAFVMRALRGRGLRPAKEADRRTIIRRLTFDLHGLPPNEHEVDAFVADDRPDAYARLVDRLLASPRFGERQARRWLDVVHYGETHGYDKDKLREHAWPYRDWVIRAFNEDKPYERFVAEQVAGDALYPGTEDGVIGLGMLAAGPWDFVGHVELREGTVDKAKTRSLDRDDVVNTVMTSFVSTTAACARCHDHKFDPVPQEDYYRLQAVFAGVERADRSYQTSGDDRWLTSSAGSLGYHSAIEAARDAEKWVQVDLGRAQPIDEVLLFPSHEVYGGHPGPGFGFPLRFRVEVAQRADFFDAVTVADHTDADLPNPGDQPQRFDCGARSARYVRVTATRLFERTDDWIFALGELVVRRGEQNLAAGAAVTALDSIEAGGAWGRKYLTDGAGPRSGALVYAAAPTFRAIGNFHPAPAPRPIHVLARGDVEQPGAEAHAGAMSCLPVLAQHFDGLEGAPEAERRAALARWLVDRRNPLTWRSIVNRVWQSCFGRGLVDTPNDFGRMGARPSHPELLDWLAATFRDDGGSLKELYRLLVTSAVYRQRSASDVHEAASRLDADNRLLWRANRRRLEVEAVHDAILAVSGKLDLTMGGPSVRWFGFVDDHSPHYHYDRFSPDAKGAYRRSVYRHIVRSVPDPFFEALDCADPSTSTPTRFQTLTPLQALAMLNDRFVLRQAEHFAARLRARSRDLEEQVGAAFRLALGRAPNRAEVEEAAGYARVHGLANLCRLVFNLNEFVFVD